MDTDQTPGGFQYFITCCVTALVLEVLPCTGGREGNICSVSAQFARLGSAVTSHPHGQGFPALVLQLLPDGQQPGRGEKIRAERAAVAQWMSDRPCCELKALGEAERGVGKGRRSAPAPWAAFGSGGLSLPARARSSPAKKEGRRVLFLLFIFFFLSSGNFVSFICGPPCCEVLAGAGSLLAPASKLGAGAVHPGWDQSPALPRLLPARRVPARAGH